MDDIAEVKNKLKQNPRQSSPCECSHHPSRAGTLPGSWGSWTVGTCVWSEPAYGWTGAGLGGPWTTPAGRGGAMGAVRLRVHVCAFACACVYVQACGARADQALCLEDITYSVHTNKNSLYFKCHRHTLFHFFLLIIQIFILVQNAARCSRKGPLSPGWYCFLWTGSGLERLAVLH